MLLLLHSFVGTKDKEDGVVHEEVHVSGRGDRDDVVDDKREEIPEMVLK